MDPRHSHDPLSARPRASWPAPATPRSFGVSMLGHATLCAAALAVTATPVAVLGGEREPPQRSIVMVLERPIREVEPPPIEPAYEVTEPETAEPLPEAESFEVVDVAQLEPRRPELTPLDLEDSLPELPLDFVLVRPREPEPAPVAVIPPETPPEPEPPATPTIVTIETAAEPIADRCPKPPYPRRAVARGWEGAVVCAISIAANGSVTAVEVRESSGHRMLDESVRASVLEWRFYPASRGGIAIETEIVKRFEFRLNE